jgi:hypothetical protein
MTMLNVSNQQSNSSTFTLETYLNCSYEVTWEAVQHRCLLEHVTHPLLKFLPAQPGVLAERFKQGDSITLNLYMLGFIPFGKDTIKLEHVQEGEIISRESGTYIKTWNHVIKLEKTARGLLYRDTLELEAGWLTPVMVVVAKLFYRHRQARWRALAPKLGSITKANV